MGYLGVPYRRGGNGKNDFDWPQPLRSRLPCFHASVLKETSHV